MKVWPADWRKSVFYQSSNASGSSNDEYRGKSGDGSDNSAEYVKNSGSEASKSPIWNTTAEPLGVERLGSVD